MSTKKTSGGFPLLISALAILICLGLGLFIYKGILGADANFEGGDADNGHPHNILGIMYKGGFIVPILIGFLLTVITFAIERFITIQKASGTPNRAHWPMWYTKVSLSMSLYITMRNSTRKPKFTPFKKPWKKPLLLNFLCFPKTWW